MQKTIAKYKNLPFEVGKTYLTKYPCLEVATTRKVPAKTHIDGSPQNKDYRF